MGAFEYVAFQCIQHTALSSNCNPLSLSVAVNLEPNAGEQMMKHQEGTSKVPPLAAAQPSPPLPSLERQNMSYSNYLLILLIGQKLGNARFGWNSFFPISFLNACFAVLHAFCLYANKTEPMGCGKTTLNDGIFVAYKMNTSSIPEIQHGFCLQKLVPTSVSLPQLDPWILVA